MDENVLKRFKLLLLLIIILLLVSFISVLSVLNMILLGAMLAYGIRPIAGKIQTKAKYQLISIVLAIILVIIPLILVLGYLLFETVGLASSFLSAGGFTFDTSSAQAGSLIMQNLPANFQNALQSYTGRINTEIANLAHILIDDIIEIVKDIPNVLVQIFVLICSIYYFAKDGDKVWDYVFAFIPDNQTSFFDRVFHDVGEVLKSIFYGHFLTALIIGIIAAIGYAILGYPFVFFLGVSTAVLQLLPILGPWMIYWVLVFYDIFVTGNIIRAVITLLFGFFLSLSDMYIRPALTSRYVDVHQLILLIGFLAGPLAFGLIGFILGPLILGITYAVIKALKDELEIEETEDLEDNALKQEVLDDEIN